MRLIGVGRKKSNALFGMFLITQNARIIERSIQPDFAFPSAGCFHFPKNARLKSDTPYKKPSGMKIRTTNRF